MTLAITCGLLWLITANLIAMFPSKDHHWRNAYGLIVIGIPILGWITYVAGPFAGVIFLAGGASILRWPVYFVAKWVLRMFGQSPAK